MAPYIVTNKDITLKHKIPNQKGKKGMFFNVEGAVKFLSSKFPDLKNLTSEKEGQLNKFIRLKQSKFENLFKKLRKSEQSFEQDPRGKTFLDTEVKVK